MMFERIFKIETTLVGIGGIVLFAFNLISLYFTIDLFSYGETSGFLSDHTEERSDARMTFYLLFVTGTANLLFVSIVLMDKWMKDKR